jgi:hypothetical protein
MTELHGLFVQALHAAIAAYDAAPALTVAAALALLAWPIVREMRRD